MKICVASFMPKYHPTTGANISMNAIGPNLIVSCKHENLPPQNQPKDLIITSSIDLDEKFGECVGLYYGDGTKHRINLEFCNSSFELASMWLTHLKSFGINPNKLHFSIKLSENSRVKYRIGNSDILSFWSGLTGKYTCKISIVKNNGHKISNYVQKFGSIRICYNDAMLSIFYNALIDNVPNFIKSNKPFLRGFLRGIIAAEGNINLRKNGSLSLLRIAGTQDERKFFSHILLRYFGIRSLEDTSNQIYVKGYVYLSIFKQFDLHVLHPSKRDKFEAGLELLEKNRIRTSDENSVLKNTIAIKLLVMLHGWHEIGYLELAKQLKVSAYYIRTILRGHTRRSGGRVYKYNGLVKLNLVRENGRGRHNLCKITSKGNKLLAGSESI